jgi:hypothetical protein
MPDNLLQNWGQYIALNPVNDMKRYTFYKASKKKNDVIKGNYLF